MDPSATLIELKWVIKGHQFSRAVDLLAAYYQWRIRGGFEPEGGDAIAENLATKLAEAIP